MCGVWSIGFAALSVMLCIVEITIGYNVPDSPSAWVFWGMTILAILILAVIPPYGALCIVICWQISYYIPFPTPSMLIVIGFVLMVFLGFLSLPIALIISLISTIYKIIAIPAGVSDASMNDTVLFLSTMVALSATGFGIRRYREYYAFLVQREQQRRRDHVIADLHDSVCNDLNLALIQLETYEAKTDLDARRNQLRHVHDDIMRALAKTRAVLDTLQDDVQDLAYPPISTNKVPLGPLIHEQRQRLEEAGFSGILLAHDSNTADADIATDENRAIVITGFIRETVNNIINHADHAHEYIMLIGVRGDTLHIEVSDTPRLNAAPHRTNGMGLSFYRNQVESLGGAITVQRDPQLWSMQATIPLSGKAAISQCM